MDKYIADSIEAKKRVITDAYQISDSYVKNRVDDLFQRMQELGNTCQEVMEFETKFLESSLYQEYTDFIVEIATNHAENLDIYQPTLQDIAKQNWNQTTMDVLRDTPIGSVMQGKQMLDVFRKNKKNSEKKGESYEKNK